MTLLNTAAYIGLNGDHILFSPHKRDGSIHRCNRPVRSVNPRTTALRKHVRLIATVVSDLFSPKQILGRNLFESFFALRPRERRQIKARTVKKAECTNAYMSIF